jgi:hypothetical protein
MKKIISILIVLICFLPSLVCADIYSNSEKFKEYNPDGQKYQFARDYLSSLNYLYANAQRDLKIRGRVLDSLKPEERAKVLKENLNLQNVNLRVARNLLKTYKTSNNGMILKVTDLFMKACNEQILINEKEVGFLNTVSSLQEQNLPAQAVVSRIKKEQIRLGLERKESLKQILRSSILVGKLLVSDKADRFGELIYLGITKEERKKLLDQLKAFPGDKFKGKLRGGQSYLEASVTTIRQVLEDQNWTTVDRIKSAT